MATRKIDMNDILIYFDYKYEGDWDEIYKAICRKERVEPEDAERVSNEQRSKYCITTLLDDNYPSSLKQTYKPPFLIKHELKSEEC